MYFKVYSIFFQTIPVYYFRQIYRWALENVCQNWIAISNPRFFSYIIAIFIFWHNNNLIIFEVYAHFADFNFASFHSSRFILVHTIVTYAEKIFDNSSIIQFKGNEKTMKGKHE